MPCALRIAAVTCALLLGCTLGKVGGSTLTDVEMAYLASAVTWDRNKDGSVSCNEWREYQVELFQLADLAKDSKLTRAEFDKIVSIDRLFAVAGFSYFDVNRDGFVDRTEFLEKPNPAFALLDKNADCILTTDELAATRSLQRPGPSGMPPKGEPKSGPPGAGKM
jgi:Ca2+-binding EF-hand superfamily protein